MSDKTEINNICENQDTVSVSVDEIWPSSDFHETCLPVIGSCQVSSILSTFEEPPSEEAEPDPDSEQKLKNIETTSSFKSIPINIINQNTDELIEDPKKTKPNEVFKEIMYLGCTLCPFVCANNSKISDHIQSVHKNKTVTKKAVLKCPCCSNIFYHKLSLKSHLIYDHEVGRNDINKIVNSVVYKCVLQQDNQNNININNNNTDNNKITEYSNDNYDYINEEPPKQESDIIINNIILKDVDEEPEKKLTKPEETSKKKHLKCYVSTCAVRMTETTNMSYHVKCHFEKIFRCLECGIKFVTWKTLQTHLWRLHNIDMELYTCDKCNYKTYSLAKLNNIHKLIHGNEKSFLCDFCGKGFKNPKQLRNHKIIHKAKLTNKHQVKCDVCNSVFNDKRILKIHIQAVHEKLKPFSCNYCSYKAASNGDLKLHVRLHTGQKPFSCDQCDYSTADHNSLRKHKSRHTNEKKYKCAHCDYACIQSSTYKTHLKTKHPGLENEHVFACELCQFRSVNRNKYLNHLAAAHSSKKQPTSENGKQTRLNLPTVDLLENTPVAVISKLDNVSNCIILPVENTGGLQSNNLQYFYNPTDVVLEIIDDKSK